MKFQDSLKLYNDNGYLIIKKYFTKNLIKNISLELNNYKKLNCRTYFDRNGKIRRHEKFYNKSKSLKILDRKIKILLNKIFKKKFTMFKDKFNLKPSNGEGFSAHYDGVFKFKINNNNFNGWYKYTDYFINVLIPIDNCNKKNGTIQLANEDKLNFHQLLKNTKKNGTPELLKSYERKLKFKHIILNEGDVCIFSNRCPHRSDKNNSNRDRRILYYTYNQKKVGNFYNIYFKDKELSKNKFKSLKGNR